eukprot:CAMPEP_0203645988 /NCGR_PEP_ID=MMETSP0088-20131115/12107_1 /ASSEMBLY_ACC=CAM_ASM_001087 /TAXON_ID=426623 /ORGANISM="Chaetoceros affinis, Strain CCMP159" /LENGTH=200 /DNA_ID=CAMNT_0050503049 /DNA_START=67 /DNA_END=669 /DNA_ORIENTATION=+
MISVGSVSAMESAKDLSRKKNVYSPRMQNKRALKKDKNKGDVEEKPMVASIGALDEYFPNFKGFVAIEYDDDMMVVDFSLRNGPGRCDKCKVVLYDGDSCDDLDDPYYYTDDNPWTVDGGSVFVTNKNGRAAGFFKINNGRKYKDNKCKYIVLFDKEEDDDRRRLERSTNGGTRELKKKKSPSGPKKIGCGQLVPEDDVC